MISPRNIHRIKAGFWLLLVLLVARSERLLVDKRKFPNLTIAVALIRENQPLHSDTC